MLSECKVLRFTQQQRDSRLFRRIATPKVVQIIVSYNNLHAFFAIFRVFGGFLCDFRVRGPAVRRRRRAARAFGE